MPGDKHTGLFRQVMTFFWLDYIPSRNVMSHFEGSNIWPTHIFGTHASSSNISLGNYAHPIIVIARTQIKDKYEDSGQISDILFLHTRSGLPLFLPI